MSRNPYLTELTDREWELLLSLIPPPKTGGRPRTVDVREIVNAILYVQRTSCSWRMLPYDFPPWPTVYGYFRFWRRSGVWDKMNQALRSHKKVELDRKRASKRKKHTNSNDEVS